MNPFLFQLEGRLRRKALDERNRCKPGLESPAVSPGKLFRGNPQDRMQMLPGLLGIRQLLGKGRQLKADPILREGNAVAVKDRTAGRREMDQAGTVLFGLFPVTVVVPT